MVYGIWYMVYGIRYTVYGIRYTVYGIRVYGYTVICPFLQKMEVPFFAKNKSAQNCPAWSAKS